MSLPSFKIAGISARHGLLLGAAIVWLAIFVFFYPSYFLSGDEHQYLQSAFFVNNGSLSVPDNGLFCEGAITPSGEMVPKYPIGKSVEIIPFLAGGLSTLFFSGAFVHLLNFLLLILILSRLKINPCYALLYLFFPAFQWEARTLYSELWVLSFYFGAYYSLLRSEKSASYVTGFILGLALFIRLDAILGIFAFLAYAIVQDRKRVLPILLGMVIPVGMLLLYNSSVYGGPFSTGYGNPSLFGASFGIGLLRELATFPVYLFLALPFSLLAAWRSPHHRTLFVALALVTIVFFVRFFSFWALETSLPHLLTVRLRYFIPLLGMLFIPTLAWYASKRAQFLAKRPLSEGMQRAGFFTLLLLMVAGSIILHSTHQNVLDSRATVAERIHTLIPESAKIIGSADDCIYFIPPLFGEKYYWRVTDLPDGFVPDSNTYILDIAYASQEDEGGTRHEIVDAERKKIKDYIAVHKDALTLVAVHAEGSTLSIWKFI